MSLNSTQDRRLPVLASSGDAPGMNAAVRAIARVGLARGLEVIGIRRGYRGLRVNGKLCATPMAAAVTREKSFDECLLRTLNYTPVS